MVQVLEQELEDLGSDTRLALKLTGWPWQCHGIELMKQWSGSGTTALFLLRWGLGKISRRGVSSKLTPMKLSSNKKLYDIADSTSQKRSQNAKPLGYCLRSLKSANKH